MTYNVFGGTLNPTTTTTTTTVSVSGMLSTLKNASGTLTFNFF